jgi:hypothetical protein
VRFVEKGQKNNTLIFGLQEEKNESYMEIVLVIETFLRDTIRTEIVNWNIGYMKRLGRRREERLILARFTSFTKILEVLRHIRNLVGTKIRVDGDFSTEIRKIRRGLIPYLKDAKKRGYKALLKEDKLVVNGQIYDMGYLKEDIQILEADQGVDKPVVNRSPGSEKMCQQNAGNKTAHVYRARREDKTVSRRNVTT